MTWYAAHIIMYAEFIDGAQDKYIILENVILLEAASVDDAMRAARAHGEAMSGDSMTHNNRATIWRFGGVRKLIECSYSLNQGLAKQGDTFQPESGAEITYSWMEVKSAAAFQKLIQGKPVRVLYEE
jgi:Domain of unknown function (DUF4288)